MLPSRKKSLSLCLVVALTFQMLTSCAINPVTGKSELVLISEQGEIDIGERAYPQMRQLSGGDFRDDDLDRYVNEVGQRLAAVSHRPNLPFHFKVVNSSIPNAYALPGGQIAIHRELLASLENEAQLAALLGHEIGHATARHYVQSLTSGFLLNVATIAISAAFSKEKYAEPVALGSVVAATLIGLKFSRNHEAQSDQLGIEYMTKAGYDPQGAVMLYEYFYKVIEKERQPIWLEGLISTHPFSLERMEACRRIADSMPRQSNWTLGEERFRQRTTRLKQVNEAYRPFDEGVKLAAQGSYYEARAKFNEAISKAPDQGAFYRERGVLFLKEMNQTAAEDDFRKSLDLDTDFYKTHFYIGLLRKDQGRMYEAEAEWKRSMALLPTKDAAYMLAKHYERLRNDREAFHYYEIIVKEGGNDEIADDARRYWEWYLLKNSPEEMVEASVRVSGAGTDSPHAVDISNNSRYLLNSVRLEIHYNNSKGRLIDKREVTIYEKVYGGKTVRLKNAGVWLVPLGTDKIETKIVGVSFRE